jgi:hypothetical protein
MAKTCPNCGYSSIGPFTDNCPICAEPVRNVRSDGAGLPWPAKVPTALRWVVGGLAVVGLCVVGCGGLGMLQIFTGIHNSRQTFEQAMAKAEADRQARTMVVTATDLLREFGNDSAAADRKYTRKYLEISGVLEKTGQGRDEAPFVVLNGEDENTKLRIECFFDSANDQEEVRIKRLEKGQAITLRGDYHGQVSNVQVRDCVLTQPPPPVRKQRKPR